MSEPMRGTRGDTIGYHRVAEGTIWCHEKVMEIMKEMMSDDVKVLTNR